MSAITRRAPMRLASSELMMLFSSSLVTATNRVHLVDVLLLEQLLVGDVAVQHQRLVQRGGEPLARRLLYSITFT